MEPKIQGGRRVDNGLEELMENAQQGRASRIGISRSKDMTKCLIY
jgi:hypothetical protein